MSYDFELFTAKSTFQVDKQIDEEGAKYAYFLDGARLGIGLSPGKFLDKFSFVFKNEEFFSKDDLRSITDYFFGKHDPEEIIFRLTYADIESFILEQHFEVQEMLSKINIVDMLKSKFGVDWADEVQTAITTQVFMRKDGF